MHAPKRSLLTDFYEREARKLIQDAKAKHQEKLQEHFAYEDLAELLRAHGMDIEHQALINKIRKANFSLTFAMEVLTVLGQPRINIPPLPPAEKAKILRRSRTARLYSIRRSSRPAANARVALSGIC
ncbi:hypothetical protein JJB11_21915 [Ramlibacter ginsenosidimutans]|uniref:DUF6471 domain-containing protein n=1 Tax=Ramlibacter ginsenosidimutans TaxID=502333 RepID=A0A934WND3_9BURK|nr:DUF6471 domain-containing protein [Ramlibacter ginsenosidimutans]MBK6008764.1 hypothetical protein [Ramlibacter ginsenosidimutans]